MALEDVIQGVQVVVKTDGIDDAKNKIAELERAITDLSKTADSASGSSSGRGGAEGGIGGLNKAFSDLNTVGAQAFANIAKSAASGDITGLATMLGGPVAGSFIEAGKAITQFIDTQDAAIIKNAAMARELGTTPTVVQGLREGFEGAGVSATGFERLINRVSRQVTNDYTEMTRNIRTDSDTQEGAMLRLQAAREKLAITKGADPAQFEWQDKLRAQKEAQIAVDQAEEAVRQQALKSIPHVTELLKEAAQSGSQNAELTEVSNKTLRQSIEHMAQTGEGPASPINVLKTEFDLIKNGAIGADKAVELLKEQMGSMRAAGLGGMDAEHLFEYAQKYGSAGITAAQAGQATVQQLGLGQTKEDTQRATETISEWSKFSSLFGAMVQKIGASFSGKDSLMDATLRGGENTINFITDLKHRLDAASKAATDDPNASMAERSKKWWEAFQNPPPVKPETETKDMTATTPGKVTVETIGGGTGKIIHVPEGYNGPAPVSGVTSSSIGDGVGRMIQVPPGYGAPSYNPNDPRFQHMSVLDDANAPWRGLRSGTIAPSPPPAAPAAQVGPISDGGIVSALTSIANRIMGIEIPSKVGGGGGGFRRGGVVRIPGFAGGGYASDSDIYAGSQYAGSQYASDIYAGSQYAGSQYASDIYAGSQYAGSQYASDSDIYAGSQYRLPGFAEGGSLWERIKQEAKEQISGFTIGKAGENLAMYGLDTLGLASQGAARTIGLGAAVLSNPLHMGILDASETGAADKSAGAAQLEAKARAMGARNLKEYYDMMRDGKGMWQGGLPGFANGSIRGPGDGTSDSIIARLSNGEFVMRDAAVRTYGEDFMHAINNMQVPPPKYADGGMVPSSMLPRFAEGGMERPGSILNLHVGDNSFMGLKAPAAVADQIRKFAIDQQTTQTGKMPSWAGG